MIYISNRKYFTFPLSDTDVRTKCVLEHIPVCQENTFNLDKWSNGESEIKSSYATKNVIICLERFLNNNLIFNITRNNMFKLEKLANDNIANKKEKLLFWYYLNIFISYFDNEWLYFSFFAPLANPLMFYVSKLLLLS